MNAAGLVAQFRARGVTLVADGDRLRCRPGSALTDDDLAVLRQYKLQLLDVLRTPRSPRVVCHACRSTRFWRSIYNVVICTTCHPPASASLVAEWIDAPDAEPRR